MCYCRYCDADKLLVVLVVSALCLLSWLCLRVRGVGQLSADLSPEQHGVLQSGAKMLKRVTCEKERLAGAVQNLQEALQQELTRRQVSRVQRCLPCKR